MDMINRFVVEPASDWETYSKAWSSAMEHLYWYKEDPVFDYNKHEELDEMKSDFGTSGHLFLIARFPDQDEIVGVLGLRYRDVIARIRRWEPAVHPKYQGLGASTVLLQQAMKHLSSMGVRRLSCLLKHPVVSPEVVERHLRLYELAGFERNRPDSIDMIKAIDDFIEPSNAPPGVHIETGENYTIEDLASITVKSFTSTPEERAIHGFDKTVTEYIQSTALLQRMADGFYGHSPDEFRKIAVVDGVSAGFLGAFVIESKHQPLTGVLGPMAVLPDYRRRGVGIYLISDALRTLKEYGCEYVAVGTPSANTGAISMYEKTGFNLACKIVSLEREL